MMDLTRREFLRTLGAAGAAVTMTGCVARSLPLDASVFPPPPQQRHPVFGFATSLREEHGYEAEVEGIIPAGLRGTLYRNGPGLFERSGLRKRALLDGDGMVQAFTFSDGTVRYRNRFVRTPKFLEEEREGRFIYPTYSTQAPGGPWANLGGPGKIKSQAGVNVFVWDGRLYAFDESNIPFELDPETLDTMGPALFGEREMGQALMAAHPKMDHQAGQWLLFGLVYGRTFRLHVQAVDRAGRTVWRNDIELPRSVYMHDWFVSERHVVFNLHPLEFDVWELLTGQVSVVDSLRWRPEKGNLIVVLERTAGAKPLLLEAPAAFMWHSVNAHEQGATIVADFIGYESPDHFTSDVSPALAVMRGRLGDFKHPGKLRRYYIDLPGRVAEEWADVHPGCEWPRVNPVHQCHAYRYGYLARSYEGEFFWSGVSRVDMQTRKSADYRFPPGVYCTEPVFAPLPGHVYQADSADEPGWLLTEGLDGETGNAFLAVFDAEHVEDGPVAIVRLRHHVPFSFHGFWQQG